MLSHWVVMVLNGNAPCHLQQCKCPDQDLWAPLYIASFSPLITCNERFVIRIATLWICIAFDTVKTKHCCSCLQPKYISTSVMSNHSIAMSTLRSIFAALYCWCAPSQAQLREEWYTIDGIHHKFCLQVSCVHYHWHIIVQKSIVSTCRLASEQKQYLSSGQKTHGWCRRCTWLKTIQSLKLVGEICDPMLLSGPH